MSDKPGVYAYVTGYAGEPRSKTVNSGEIGRVRLTVPGYRDTDPDEVYHVTGWGHMADEVLGIREGALVKISGYLKQRAWEASGARHFAVELNAKRVEIKESPPEPEEEPFEDDDIPF